MTSTPSGDDASNGDPPPSAQEVLNASAPAGAVKEAAPLSERAASDERDEAPDALQKFIFYRELAEVYLLFDNISTTLGKVLPPPREPNPATGDPGEPDWVQEICQIGWPPTGSEDKLDRQAATLIRARDRLNTVAAPATGFTIAFTLLVAGEQTSREAAGSRHKRAQRGQSEDRGLDDAAAAFLQGGGRGQPPPSRFLLANIAYPGLRRVARRFIWFKIGLLAGLLVLFLGTSLLSWNIATGNALLSQLTTLESVTAAKPATSSTATAGISDRSGAATCAQDTECERRLHSLMVAEANLRNWSNSWTFLGWVLPDMSLACSKDNNYTVCPPANEQWISTFLSVLGGAVLPIFYGALGAGVAVVRSLSDRIRDSRLAPRYLTLFLVQLVLGAVLGGCIGLFTTPSSPQPGQAPGLLGTVPLSASALCFLAGFSVEGVFQALDGFIRRVFNLPDPPKSGQAPSVAATSRVGI